jgi:hypothetical protein
VLDYVVWHSSDKLHLEEAELGINGVQLVHNRFDLLVFLQTR